MVILDVRFGVECMYVRHIIHREEIIIMLLDTFFHTPNEKVKLK